MRPGAGPRPSGSRLPPQPAPCPPGAQRSRAPGSRGQFPGQVAPPPPRRPAPASRSLAAVPSARRCRALPRPLLPGRAEEERPEPCPRPLSVAAAAPSLGGGARALPGARGPGCPLLSVFRAGFVAAAAERQRVPHGPAGVAVRQSGSPVGSTLSAESGARRGPLAAPGTLLASFASASTHLHLSARRLSAPGGP